MIIAICGTGYSGSSAVTDYLRGSNELSVCPYDIEFMFLYDVDGIDDLKHHIVDRPVRYYSSDAALKRYEKYIKDICSPNSMIHKLCGKKIIELTHDYIDSLTQLSWKGWWHFDVRTSKTFVHNFNFRFLAVLNRFFKKIGGKGFNIYSKSKMRLSLINNTDFMTITRKYVMKIVDLFNVDKKSNVVLDFPFPFGQMDYYKKYFNDNIKTINIVRDPRDTYIIAKRIAGSFGSWIPTDNVFDFINYYKLLCSKKIISASKEELLINFEDLIYDYDNVSSIINNFLGLQKKIKSVSFDPKKSINNTQLFLKYPEYSKDVSIIEKELKEYLYDFDKFEQKPSFDDNSF